MHSAGPLVDGLDLDPTWTESANEVRWGERLVPIEALRVYAGDHPDTTASVYVGGHPDGVLQVVDGHVEEVRGALTQGGAEPCIEMVTHSRAELEAAQDALSVRNDRLR